MTEKQKWEKKLQEQGFDVKLDEHNVIMFKTADKEEADKYREVMADYPYSWGIKRRSDGQEDILQDTEDD